MMDIPGFLPPINDNPVTVIVTEDLYRGGLSVAIFNHNELYHRVLNFSFLFFSFFFNSGQIQCFDLLYYSPTEYILQK